ncbi:MAG: integrase [Bacteroides sp. SM1_62]|nr:MAG: integrase [Bacteroides sp. SM23_62]KPL23318.1 MAG: integrase [Bacteroides sp. SM1_62]
MNYKKLFLNYLQFEKRYSQHTIISYQTDLDQFEGYARNFFEDEEGLDRAGAKVIRSWIAHMMESGMSVRSVNRKITTLKTFYKFMMREQHIKINPMDKVISPKLKKTLPAFVEEEKMDELLDSHAFGKDFHGARNKLIIELLYLTGMRLSELIQLEDRHIDLYEHTIKVTGKRNKERIIPLEHAAIDIIRNYLNLRKQSFPGPSTPRFFITDKGKPLYPKFVYKVVNNYLRLVTTMQQRSPHVLRHSFATHMLNRGADLNAIKEILGHADLSATQVYTHNTFEKLVAIYKQAHPRA